jgi:hypothetical protein
MVSKMGRSTGMGLFAAVALVLAAEHVQAQPGACGRQQGRSRQYAMQPTPSTQQYALQGQLPLMQNGLRAQFPLPLDPTLGAWPQQNALLVALQQQNAQLQQQNAQLVAQQLRQQQNAQLIARQLQQAPPNAQPRPAQDPAGGDPADKPEDPEATAARKLQMARDLLADAGKARFDGEDDRAARMRRRAAERLRDVIARYQGTRAADQAQALLDKLDS